MALKEQLLKRNYQAMKMMDANQDGYLSYEDFAVAAKNYGGVGGAKNPKAQKEYVETLRSVFEIMGLLEKKILISDVVEQSMSLLKNPEFEKRMKRFYSAVFDTLDIDGNGFISPEEWVVYMERLNFTDPSKGKEIFETMDLNKDGQLSREEFVEMSFEYWNVGGDKCEMFGGQ